MSGTSKVVSVKTSKAGGMRVSAPRRPKNAPTSAFQRFYKWCKSHSAELFKEDVECIKVQGEKNLTIYPDGSEIQQFKNEHFLFIEDGVRVEQGAGNDENSVVDAGVTDAGVKLNNPTRNAISEFVKMGAKKMVGVCSVSFLLNGREKIYKLQSCQVYYLESVGYFFFGYLKGENIENVSKNGDGVIDYDVETVMKETGCSTEEAVERLKKVDGDVVKAIVF